jgi:hypothetical protein
LLPPRYFAEAQVKVGTRIATDVDTFEENGAKEEGPRQEETGSWTCPPPVAIAPLNFGELDRFEVQIINDEEGPQVVAAVELISPANKDRLSHRQMFTVKCASYLQQKISLVMVDVVTERSGNLHAELLRLLGIDSTTPAQGPTDLYATAYRTVAGGDVLALEMWVEGLGLGSPLPTVPLWISDERCLPLDLERAYLAACAARRIT